MFMLVFVCLFVYLGWGQGIFQGKISCVALIAPSVDQASLEPRDLLLLRLKMYTTTIGLEMVFLY